MKGYLSLLKGTYMARGAYRFTFLFTLTGNLLYIALLYFLWASIYRQSETLRGMTFNQAFVYVALAGSIFVLFKTWTEWGMSRSIVNGAIVVDLIKPLDYQLQMLSRAAGFALTNLVLITAPSVLVLFLAFGVGISPSIGLVFFPMGLLLAFLISFNLDYIVGLSGFYTESLWGISMTKEIITSLLSGALVPLQFFPEAAQSILRLLPFQAIYHVPLTMVTSPVDLQACLRLLAVQAFWVVALFALSRLVYNKAVKVLTVNGG
ncbi:MAG: ABC-2 family transporter protein [Thermoflexales bacterium]|nr:ABC-2 family transporter protein [Thermoflexales bacterium]